MKIAEIAPPWIALPPTGYGGIELVVSLLASGLQERGHSVSLFAADGSHSEADVISPLPPAGTELIGDPWFEAYHAVVAHLRADEFDIVHDHTFLGPALAAMRDGVPPVVHTLHGPWDERARGYYDLVHDGTHLVAISSSQRAANGSVRYAATIPNGIDVDQYPLGEGPRDDFLVYIGRSNADKAPERAVEVAHRSGRPIKLIVKRAEPAEQEHWERHVEPRLDGTEEILDDVDHETKVDLLQRGHAFVFPIQWEEPFGLVMIEAMACGMPVVAAPRGAASEIVVDGETGYLREDLDEIADAVAKADQISPQACRGRVEEHFSAEAMVSRYDDLFKRIDRRQQK
jgi:glycosyltransferase involved in cell wall biosynthesis